MAAANTRTSQSAEPQPSPGALLSYTPACCQKLYNSLASPQGSRVFLRRFPTLCSHRACVFRSGGSSESLVPRGVVLPLTAEVWPSDQGCSSVAEALGSRPTANRTLGRADRGCSVTEPFALSYFSRLDLGKSQGPVFQHP